MPAGGLVTAAAIAGGMAIYGGIKESQAAKKAKANLANRPKWQSTYDPSELNLAQSQASTGMGAGARQSMLNAQQGSTAAITNAALMGGADPNAIAGIENSSQQALNSIGIYDDQVRQSHLNSLLSTYRSTAAQKRSDADKAFQVNDYAPWADRQQLYNQEKQAGQNMMMSGVNSFTKSLVGMGGLPGGTSPDITMNRQPGDSISPLPTSGGYGMYPDNAPPPGMAPYFSVSQYP